MPKLRELRDVDVQYATSGPNQKTLRQEVPAPAADLFRCLADGPAWKEWLGIEVEWTSPEPHGVGTTRTVTLARQTIEEEFLAWEDGERMNFRFTRCTLPVSAFAEDYRIEPAGPDACVLHWSYAYEWGGPGAAIVGRLFGLGFAANNRRSLKKLAVLMSESGTRFSD